MIFLKLKKKKSHLCSVFVNYHFFLDSSYLAIKKTNVFVDRSCLATTVNPNQFHDLSCAPWLTEPQLWENTCAIVLFLPLNLHNAFTTSRFKRYSPHSYYNICANRDFIQISSLLGSQIHAIHNLSLSLPQHMNVKTLKTLKLQCTGCIFIQITKFYLNIVLTDQMWSLFLLGWTLLRLHLGHIELFVPPWWNPWMQCIDMVCKCSI